MNFLDNTNLNTIDLRERLMFRVVRDAGYPRAVAHQWAGAIVMDYYAKTPRVVSVALNSNLKLPSCCVCTEAPGAPEAPGEQPGMNRLQRREQQNKLRGLFKQLKKLRAANA
jgi:hypothetical protein